MEPHYEDVHHLITNIKSPTVKHKNRQAKFAIIDCPHQLVITRLGSWLNAALYYAKNLPEVKAIVESFKGSNTVFFNLFRAVAHFKGPKIFAAHLNENFNK